jgi:hypothetical protein
LDACGCTALETCWAISSLHARLSQYVFGRERVSNSHIRLPLNLRQCCQHLVLRYDDGLDEVYIANDYTAPCRLGDCNIGLD